MAYGSGKNSIAICDRCGMKHKYTELQVETDTKLMVCNSCIDPADPYRRILSRPREDRISLRRPRPDVPLTIPE